MKEELKQKWVAALRSGKYAQGRTMLRDIEDRYCCLGVLCVVEGTPWDELNKISRRYWIEGESGTLPAHIRKATEITAEEEGTLIGLNDNAGYSFAQIADWVEAHL